MSEQAAKYLRLAKLNQKKNKIIRELKRDFIHQEEVKNRKTREIIDLKMDVRDRDHRLDDLVRNLEDSNKSNRDHIAEVQKNKMDLITLARKFFLLKKGLHAATDSQADEILDHHHQEERNMTYKNLRADIL